MWRLMLNRFFRNSGRTGGGVYVDRLPVGSRIVVETENRQYLVETRGGCNVLINGHPRYCPEPFAVAVRGAIRKGSKIEPLLVGSGMPFEFWHPTIGIFRTSRVRGVRVVEIGALPHG